MNSIIFCIIADCRRACGTMFHINTHTIDRFERCTYHFSDLFHENNNNQPRLFIVLFRFVWLGRLLTTTTDENRVNFCNCKWYLDKNQINNCTRQPWNLYYIFLSLICPWKVILLLTSIYLSAFEFQCFWILIPTIFLFSSALLLNCDWNVNCIKIDELPFCAFFWLALVSEMHLKSRNNKSIVIYGIRHHSQKINA